MKKALKGACIFSGKDFLDNKALLFEDDNIIDILDDSIIPSDFEIQSLNGGILSPGFIDLQVNGGGGKLFNNSPDKESLNTIISAHQYFGTTSIMPTVISDSLNVLQQCTDTISKEINKNLDKLIKSILDHDTSEFINVVENEALTLHAMMLSSNPSFILLKPNTINIINKIWSFRSENNTTLCFTLDAGANIHLLYHKDDFEAVQNFIKEELLVFCSNGKYINDKIGEGGIKK